MKLRYNLVHILPIWHILFKTMTHLKMIEECLTKSFIFLIYSLKNLEWHRKKVCEFSMALKFSIEDRSCYVVVTNNSKSVVLPEVYFLCSLCEPHRFMAKESPGMSYVVNLRAWLRSDILITIHWPELSQLETGKWGIPNNWVTKN